MRDFFTALIGANLSVTSRASLSLNCRKSSALPTFQPAAWKRFNLSVFTVFILYKNYINADYATN